MTRIAQLAILTTALFATTLHGTLPLAVFAAPKALPAAQKESSSGVFTNTDVIKMAQAHLSADVIIGQIQSSSCRFSLSTNGLIALKQAGVPDKVIAAMQAKGSAAAPAGRTGDPHASNAISSGREYTAPEIEKLLPAILSKAAVAHGLTAHDYDKEAAYISQFLDTCALDSTNVKVQMPNPRLPQYDICQRRTYQHTHIEGLLDVSVAAGNSHREGGAVGVARGDLLMDVGQPPNQWWPGQTYTISLKILVDQAAGSLRGPGPLIQNRLDTVLEGARIKGHAPKPVEMASATSNQTADPGTVGSAPSVSSAAPIISAQPATPYPVVDPSADIRGIYPLYQLALLYIRRTPTVLDDPGLLQSFVRIISCGDSKVALQMSNEFDSPRILSYYKSNAPSILSNVPSNLTLRIPIKLGEYDFSSSSFPFRATPPPKWPTAVHPERIEQPMQGIDFDHADYGLGGGRPNSQGVCRGAQQWVLPAVDGKAAVYEVAVDPVTIDRIEMDQSTAQKYIEDHPDRVATIAVNIELPDEAPKVYRGGGQLNAAVVFAGHVTGVSLYDRYPSGKVLQTIRSGVSTNAPDGTGAHTSSVASKGSTSTPPPSGTASSISPDNSALPVPAVHDGTMGKVLLGFLNKCSAGDSKGCEMVGFNLDKGWGADKDPQAASAYYQKACSLGRTSDCNK